MCTFESLILNPWALTIWNSYSRICPTKLQVRQYLSPLKMDHPQVVLVTSDLDGLLEQFDPFSQRYPISFNGKRYWQTNSLARCTSTIQSHSMGIARKVIIAMWGWEDKMQETNNLNFFGLYLFHGLSDQIVGPFVSYAIQTNGISWMEWTIVV